MQICLIINNLNTYPLKIDKTFIYDLFFSKVIVTFVFHKLITF